LSKTEKSEGKEGQEKQSSKPGDADGSLNATKTLFNLEEYIAPSQAIEHAKSTAQSRIYYEIIKKIKMGNNLIG
jgi:hypothetical protein